MKNDEAMKDTKAGDDEVWVLEVLKSVLGWYLSLVSLMLPRTEVNLLLTGYSWSALNLPRTGVSFHYLRKFVTSCAISITLRNFFLSGCLINALNNLHIDGSRPFSNWHFWPTTLHFPSLSMKQKDKQFMCSHWNSYIFSTMQVTNQ